MFEVNVSRKERFVEQDRVKLSFENVSKQFSSPSGAIAALENINLRVRAEEFLCIVGPSGCGKSTLLNLMSGLDQPTTGVIRLNGRVVTDPGPDRVVVFQDGALFPWLNVVGNVEFGLKMRGVPKRARREQAMAALQMVRLEKFKDAYIHQLSGGMRQRVAIARGLVLDPDVLLMDEPFAALDAQTRDSMHEELHRIWSGTKKTIVFVTHNVREAARLADRVVLMTAHPGRIGRIFSVDLPKPRFIEDHAVIDVAWAITAELKKGNRYARSH